MGGYWEIEVEQVFEADIELPTAAFKSKQPDHFVTDLESPRILSAVVQGLQTSGFRVTIPENLEPIPGYFAEITTAKCDVRLDIRMVSGDGEYNRFRVNACVSPASSRPKDKAGEGATADEDAIDMVKSALNAQVVGTVTRAGGRILHVNLENRRNKYSFLRL